MDQLRIQKKTVFWGGIALLVILYIALKSLGFHFDGLRIVSGGELRLLSTATSTTVFLDNKTYDREELQNVPPGVHSVIVFDETMWPWKKDVMVYSNEVSIYAPFLVSKSVSGEIITQNDPDYLRIRNEITNRRLPRQESPLLSKSSLVEVWSDGNAIFARYNGKEENIPYFFCNDERECSSLVKVFESEGPIRNIGFYKGRDDILLLAVRDGVFAIEIDKRGGTQNFQPVYKGTSEPRFSVESESGIYVLDGGLLFLVSI